MKYRHSFHAGNFADVHKHVTLIALLTALKRKEKGFAYFETHAGRGAYDLSHPSAESRGGIGRFSAMGSRAPELEHYAASISEFRTSRNNSHLYPGSPLIAARELRPQDRAVLSEIVPSEARLLEQALQGDSRVRIELGDGFERLRAWLPPRERRALTLIDPPYEQTRQDFDRARAALLDTLRRFSTGVVAVWYPIKDARETLEWRSALARAIDGTMLASELWLYPPDSQVALNGSGMVIANPPYLLAERMEVWLPELQAQLDVGHGGGSRVTVLPHSR